MKFEAQFGYFSDTITIETNDFDIIKIFQEFIEFQEIHGWAVKYEAVCDDTEEEEVPHFALSAKEEL
jgi:hypothetical protein